MSLGGMGAAAGGAQPFLARSSLLFLGVCAPGRVGSFI